MSDQFQHVMVLTTIYFLLVKGQYGRWHRVASDEVWHFYEGDPLEAIGLMGARHRRFKYSSAVRGHRWVLASSRVSRTV